MEKPLFSDKERAFNPLLEWEKDAHLFHFFRERGERLKLKRGSAWLSSRSSGIEGCMRELLSFIGSFALAVIIAIGIQSVIYGQPLSFNLIFSSGIFFNLIIILIIIQTIQAFFRNKSSKRNSPGEAPFPNSLFEVLHASSESANRVNVEFYTDLYLSDCSGSDLLKNLYLEGAKRENNLSYWIGKVTIVILTTVAFAVVGLVSAAIGLQSTANSELLAPLEGCMSILPSILLSLFLFEKYPTAGRISHPFNSRILPLWNQWRQPISWIPSGQSFTNITWGSFLYILSQILAPLALAVIYFSGFQNSPMAIFIWSGFVSAGVLFFTVNSLLNCGWRRKKAIREINSCIEYADDLFAIYMEEHILSEDSKWDKALGSLKDIFKGSRDKLPAKEPRDAATTPSINS